MASFKNTAAAPSAPDDHGGLECVIDVLLRAVEWRDPYTSAHQVRVAALAEKIAAALDLPALQVKGARLAALAHDVGKLGVPVELLVKPGRLTDLERPIMQGHVAMGHEIVDGVAFVWPIAQAILQHHERLDGSGYPGGLTGDAILIEAKILAVADTVDCMMSDRPYRSALGAFAALDEICAGSGRLYDPEAVEVCVRLVGQSGAH